ncbi:MAG: type II toxin-antitoxin system VapC family toxin [Bryobacteraceae bacterium]|nr:type II toxin-antitoxin system VapC family toxin [Bryobacteraceae bacterium]
MVAYFDATFIAKAYVNEPESDRVREFVAKSSRILTSAISVVEVEAAFHRQFREGRLTAEQARELGAQFEQDMQNVWTPVPMTPDILKRTALRFRILPQNVFLRAGDAIHLVSALEARSDEIWTNDRRLLAAAPHFGLLGRTI